MSTFVSVGNATQPFSRLLDEVARIASDLPQPVIVQHGNTTFQSEVCKAIPFVDIGEFERLVAEAELLILHAGAGSVIHAVRSGKIPVVMARRRRYGELVDDHQLEFARALADAAKVVMAEEPEFLPEAAVEAIKRQGMGRPLVENSRMVSLITDVLHGYATGSRR